MPDRGLVVVADSSPLIALARIEQLGLLPSLYERVTVPEAVWQEVTRGASEQRAGAADVQRAAWIDVQRVDPRDIEAHALLVDRGEAEAMALLAQAHDLVRLTPCQSPTRGA
jgi:predicted nucleic acid-binding protein